MNLLRFLQGPPKVATLAANVARGAALLDKQRPGWEDRVRLRRLDINDPCDCMLGQLYHDFEIGLVAVGLSRTDPQPAIEHGVLSGSLNGGERAHDYSILKRLWKMETHKRRDANEKRRQAEAAARLREAEPVVVEYKEERELVAV